MQSGDEYCERGLLPKLTLNEKVVFKNKTVTKNTENA